MKFAMSLMILGTFSNAHAGTLGGTVENGGNVIMCMPLGSSPVEIVSPIPEQQPIVGADGDFEVLDYLRALRDGYLPGEFVNPKDWDAEQARLARVLGDISPRLEASFLDFAVSTRQITLPQDRSSLRRTWIPTKGNMQLGEKPDWELPSRCYMLRNISTQGVVVTVKLLSYMRTVTRRQTDRRVDYLYDPLWMRNVQQTGALQYSFLLTHEWLWDFTQNLDVNQTVNAFLHRRDIDSMSAGEIRARLHELGLRF